MTVQFDNDIGVSVDEFAFRGVASLRPGGYLERLDTRTGAELGPGDKQTRHYNYLGPVGRCLDHPSPEMSHAVRERYSQDVMKIKPQESLTPCPGRCVFNTT